MEREREGGSEGRMLSGWEGKTRVERGGGVRKCAVLEGGKKVEWRWKVEEWMNERNRWIGKEVIEKQNRRMDG